MKTHQRSLAATCLIAALAATGCRGGSDDEPLPSTSPTTMTEVPDSAGISTAAFVNFMLGLSDSDESSDPLTLKEAFDVPADDTTEPTLLT